MKRKPKACQNCGHKTEALRRRDDTWMCDVCLRSMPGIYTVGDKGSTSLPAIIMRQNAFCTNLILDEIRKMRGSKS